jgi:hypothetical protein
LSVKIVLCVNIMYSTVCWKHSRLVIIMFRIENISLHDTGKTCNLSNRLICAAFIIHMIFFYGVICSCCWTNSPSRIIPNYMIKWEQQNKLMLLCQNYQDETMIWMHNLLHIMFESFDKYDPPSLVHQFLNARIFNLLTLLFTVLYPEQ